ncbi:protein CLMP1-like [Lycium ferocissimum]|uniref:protein CLMP1-like n=1 Tax=Lycium ferocissimum TaxID=112874 RepID=UPI0028156FA5|nr:protein CLMP1-like [Lycium ferocissimum]
MGKSGGRKKKGGVSQNQNQGVVGESHNNNKPVVVNGTVDLDPSIFLKRAHELKEEGNKRFQAKDFVGALQQYDNALKLTPKGHPERAVFHGNRAACLMQMKPIDYDSVISECTMALQVQPRYVRALLRRARAFEAVGKYEMALQDVQMLVDVDGNHWDALEIAGRLSMILGPRQDLQSRPSPAALGASAVGAASIAGLGGPCLPSRSMSKKPTPSAGASVVSVNNNKPDKPSPVMPAENGKVQMPRVVLKPSNGPSKPNPGPSSYERKEQASIEVRRPSKDAVIRWRPLKLVYDHDIRLSQMPVNCSFRVLRDIVTKRFAMSKSVLVKYKDGDGDLVTITCTAELRLAESWVDSLVSKDPDADEGDSIGMLRLHIVEVSPEQEPALLEEEEERPVESEEIIADESRSHSSLSDSVVETLDSEINKTEKGTTKEKTTTEDPECKEVEMDDWLFEFAQLFRTHVGIDPDAHIDLHELGMELSSEALEETVTSEAAQALFDKAALKFQEVAALAFFNWGNVHMCAARKRMPIDDSATKEETMATKLQAAYDWVKEKYSLAKEKYEEALSIKPDFYEGLLALGQQQFEMAKLHWSFVLAKKEDLSNWDPTETLALFESAEEKMKAATQMWEKLEELRANELKDPSASKKDELLKRKKKPEGEVSATGEISAGEAAQQAAVMRSQIHLFWGNMLFERSQVECKLGLTGWKENLDTAVERFKLAGASEIDIATVLKNHCSNEEQMVENLKTEGNDNPNDQTDASKA